MSAPKQTNDCDARTPEDTSEQLSPKQDVMFVGIIESLVTDDRLADHIPLKERGAHAHETAEIPFKTGAEFVHNAFKIDKTIN